MILSCDRAKESETIISILIDSKEYKEAETILAYTPLSDEIDITPLLCDKRILLPYIEKGKMYFSASKSFHRAPLGFYEPEHEEAHYDKALMLVPLLGYNERLYRLGRGGGYYDRYIKENRNRIYSIGLAFSSSKIEFTEEEFDAKLDSIITCEGRIPAFQA